MSINYRDPRYQQAVLSSTSNPLANSLAAQEQTTAGFVQNQLQVQNDFSKLGLQQKMFEGHMQLANERLKWQKDSFYKGLNNAEKASKLQMYGGIGNMLVAGYIGKQQRDEKEKEAAQRKKIFDSLYAQYGTEGVL